MEPEVSAPPGERTREQREDGKWDQARAGTKKMQTGVNVPSPAGDALAFRCP